MGGGDQGDSGPEEVNGTKFIGRAIEGLPAKDLRGLVDRAKTQMGSGVAAMIALADDGKAGVCVGVTDDLQGKFSAVDLVRAAAEALGGSGGGGRPDMAQAGGPDGSKADEALAAVRRRIAG